MKALARRGHTVIFYERDVPYYASTRDEWEPPRNVSLRLYKDWDEIRGEAALELAHAEVGMTTSYCPDGVAAARLVLDSPAEVRVFYDLDTPVTLSAFEHGRPIPYLLPEGLGAFDLVLSYTGGRALDDLRSQLGARRVAPLYGWVDVDTHRPAKSMEEFRSDLCYLGTYAADRQQAVNELLVETARREPSRRFVIGGAQYPDNFPWTDNIFFVRHLPPSLHPAFFCSARMTLNVTRETMATYGYCPSGRLFEAAACGVPIVTDWWEGLDTFFERGAEVIAVSSTEDVIRALSTSDEQLARMAHAARDRVLACHTAENRAEELEAILSRVVGDACSTRKAVS